MIDRQTVQRIQDAVRIEEVVGDFVSLRKRGANLIGLCPFHNEKTGSFTVSPARGIFKCFGCGEGGNAINFLMKHEHIEYPDALRYLAKKYHIEIVEKELTEEEKVAISERDSMLNINEFAASYFAQNLKRDEGRAVGLSYFYERGFSDEVIKKFGLGYSIDSYDDFSEEAKKRSFSEEHLIKTGLSFRNDRGNLTDRFRGRVMFPIHSLAGKVIAFGGRVLKTSDKVAKYVNSPESEVYKKNQELYGIFLAKSQIVRQDVCYLVEGYTDVISMHQSGIENVVASSGTSLTEGQIKLIRRFTANIVLIYDGDSAGIKASLRGIDMLLAQGMNVKVVLLPEGEDPDSFARKNNASDFIDYIEKHQEDFIRFKIRVLKEDAKSDPIKRASMIKEIIQSIAEIPDNIIRMAYSQETASLLDITEELIYSELNKIILAKKEAEFKEKQRQTQAETTATEGSATQVKSIVASSRHPLYKHEKEFAELIVKSGNKKLIIYEDVNGFTRLGDYIVENLRESGIELQTPLFKEIFEQFVENSKNPGFSSEQFFSFNSNPEISKFAIKCLTHKKIEADSEDEELRIKQELQGLSDDNLQDSFKRLRLEKELENRKLEEQERLNQLKNSIDKMIVEYAAAILNLELKQKLDQIESAADKLQLIEEYKTTLEMRKELVTSILKNRVVMNLGK